MGVEPTRTGFADRCLSRSTITPLLTFDVTIYHRFRKMQAVFLKKSKGLFPPGHTDDFRRGIAMGFNFRKTGTGKKCAQLRRRINLHPPNAVRVFLRRLRIAGIAADRKGSARTQHAENLPDVVRRIRPEVNAVTKSNEASANGRFETLPSTASTRPSRTARRLNARVFLTETGEQSTPQKCASGARRSIDAMKKPPPQPTSRIFPRSGIRKKRMANS